MATKCFAKMLLEGGHTDGYNVYLRSLKRSERQRNRVLCKYIARDEDLEPDTVFEQKTVWRWTDYSDKHMHCDDVTLLIQSFMNKPWNEMFRVITSRYRKNNFRSRWIREQIQDTFNSWNFWWFHNDEEYFMRTRGFWIDECGIIRKPKPNPQMD